MDHIAPVGWMGAMKEHLYNAPLNEVALPGTHDSCTSHISSDLDFSSDFDMPEVLEKLNSIPGIRDALKSTFLKWSKAQAKEPIEQLMAGVRYLDLRVCSRGDDPENLHYAHGMYSQHFMCVMNEVRWFVENYPDEIVLLDFNHFYHMDDRHHLALLSAIWENLGPYLAPNSFSAKSTCGEFWGAGRNIVVLYNAACPGGTPGCLPELIWSQSKIRSHWPDKRDEETLIEDLAEEVTHRGDCKEQFWVIQGICTPDTNSIVNGIVNSVVSGLPWVDKLPASLVDLADRTTEKLLDKLEKEWEPEGTIGNTNIIICDHFHKYNFTNRVLRLNLRRTWPAPCA